MEFSALSTTDPHLQSFNEFLQTHLVTKDTNPHACVDYRKFQLVLRMTSITVGYPVQHVDSHSTTNLTPRECRERQISYSAPTNVTFEYRNSDHAETRIQTAGNLPIMVLSNRCHLSGLNEAGLVAAREESCEFGGYFIINGLEKVLRLIQVPMRNMPLAIRRSAFKGRGPFYTQYAVMMRCARSDQSSCTITIHYLSNGNLRLRVSVRKQELLIPLVIILKALQHELTDRSNFTHLTRTGTSNAPLGAVWDHTACATARNNKASPLALLGSMCASLFRENLLEHTDNAAVGLHFLKQYIAVHVDHFPSKHDILMLMARKLCFFAQAGCSEDNVDSISHQELLLPGHVLSAYTKEKLADAVTLATSHLQRDACNAMKSTESLTTGLKIMTNCSKIVNRYISTVGAKIGAFIATGNLVSSSGLDLQQTTGFTVVAERLNKWRYLSHFRSVHRGQFFTSMKTTSVRKLLPDSWGFLCPVHTPDGTPCGLLSHLAAKAHVICSVRSTPSWHFILLDALISLGMIPVNNSRDAVAKIRTSISGKSDDLHVSLDGVVLGFASDQMCAKASMILRRLKVNAFPSLGIEATIEIAHLKQQGLDSSSPFAGLYLFSQPARLVRPVLQCGKLSRIELIGPLEQSTLQITCDPRSFALPGTDVPALVLEAHAEIDPTYMLSVLASLTPFSDFNQSPRNMYQCQMGKQTMGTPAHSLCHRSDNKLYRILTPQSPLVCTQDYHKFFKVDPYAQGTNSIVAVVAYTGYDMEDAMIVNKSAYERGFGHGLVYKSLLIDLGEEAERRKMDSCGRSAGAFRFGNINRTSHCADHISHSATCFHVATLGEDGLPAIGQSIVPGDPLWCAHSEDDETIVGNHKDTEMAYVDSVRFIGGGQFGKGVPRQKVSITLRFPRNPVIGDKFSSRHGQKGVLSSLWLECDMPFSDSGFTPDIIINPHAFPSRMTIGMLVESIAGKYAALSGRIQDGTPFAFHQKAQVVDHLGAVFSCIFFADRLCL
mmetsp:Transcript_5671/g.17745  ORF Transcript_5671/g.17745 Transcript_5671/m.17745 type:complete len:1002 (-) Transcript_5671:1003-4008(-)